MKYFDFLQKKHALDARLGFEKVDLQLLEAIAIAAHKDVPLSVTEAMVLRQLASPATIHRALDRLLASGMVKHKNVEDNRTKRLFPTAMANKYFRMLEKMS